ncbi:NAD(P)H-dependent oxidoreductase [Rubritalea tangerina]|uniref:NAD(P)H-dependent oxidoreductase n=1 Tax=Rubritalea tangerina TaxID=430798 RepID=A0ABW4ZDE0_9BACT
MKKILIQFAHPALARSRMNAAMLRAVSGVDHVTVNDLYASYPDFQIDVEREKKLCEYHDVIIFQHPFYWYSTPSIMKEWLDLVLQHGWAYGSTGKALDGKLFLQAITAGGGEETYQTDGYNQFTLGELTSPYRATAHLCGMVWLPPFVVLGVHGGLNPEQMQAYAEEYKSCVLAIRDERIDINSVRRGDYLNSELTMGAIGGK